ncbi:nitroreductase family protein, partial [Alteripontixanthobacter muriae]|uniref:nitroreductase family protein n=1 Tax=Alteripontixanthobacter muriae TaxID=2705546 RepID=UPI001E481A5A
MDVTTAVETRRSIRNFTDRPVDAEKLKRVLERAQRSPSGGNTQPWHGIVLTGEPLADLTREVLKLAAEKPMGDGAEYAIYPEGLDGRFEEQRRAVG